MGQLLFSHAPLDCGDGLPHTRGMNKTEKFLARLEADIVAFCKKRDMTESRFGRAVGNNTEVVPRLRRAIAGQANMSSKTMLAISRYLADNK